MDQFYIGSVVWASARGDIFWPGQVGSLLSVISVRAVQCITALLLFKVKPYIPHIPRLKSCLSEMSSNRIQRKFAKTREKRS